MLLFPLLALAPVQTPAPALAEAQLVLDINTTLTSSGIQSSDPHDFRDLGGGTAAFVASGSGLSQGLWRLPIGGDAEPLTTPKESRLSGLALLDSGRLVFSSKPAEDRALGVSDGTVAGTLLPIDPSTGEPIPVFGEPVAGGSRAWFSSSLGPSTLRIGSTDGTPTGAVLEFQISTGGSLMLGAFFHPVDQGLFLSAFQAGEPSLFFTPGSGAAPVDLGMFEDEFGGGDLIRQSIAFQSELWFAAGGAGGEGREPWRSDGTPSGTALFSDLEPGPGSSNPRWIAADAQRLFFATFPGTGGSTVAGLWVVDGSSAGATQLTDPATGVGVLGGALRPDGRLLFATNFPTQGELWLSDGTPAGTQPFTSVGDTVLGDFLAVGPLVYFATKALNGDQAELWVTDGTAAGTLFLGLAYRNQDSDELFGSADGTLLFARFSSAGEELWGSAGTLQTTEQLANVAPELTSNGSFPEQWLRLGGRAVFTAASSDVSGPAIDREPWVTDGTMAGTQRLADLTPGDSGSSPEFAGEVGGRVVFVAWTPATGRELWTTDGTPAGTQLLVDTAPGIESSVFRGFVPALGRLYFTVQAGPAFAAQELWFTDGTPAGTRVVDPDLDLSFFIDFEAAPLGSGLVFAQVEAGAASELWITDGTPAGTGPLPGLSTGAEGATLRDFTALDGAVYYTGFRSDIGRELFRTDGTSAGTELLADLEPGLASSDPRELTVAGDRLVLKIKDSNPIVGSVVVTSDGTTAGTVRLSDLDPALPPMKANLLNSAGDRVAFLDTFAGPAGFWLTDGKLGGTHFVTATGAYEFEPDLDRVLLPSDDGSGLFFSATDDDGGSELWWWRGPGFEAQRVIDLAPGFTGSGAELLGEVAGRLLLSGSGGSSSAELFRIELADLGLFGAEPVGSPCGASAASRIGFAGEVAVGEAFELTVSGGPPLQLALGFYGGGVSLIPLGAGCVAYLAAPNLLGSTTTDAEGAAALGVALPDSPALVGLLVTAQWVLVEPGGPLGGTLGLSDALELVLGS